MRTSATNPRPVKKLSNDHLSVEDKGSYYRVKWADACGGTEIHGKPLHASIEDFFNYQLRMAGLA